MAFAQTGAGDPARTVAALWRHALPGRGSGHGPQKGLTVDAVVTAAIALADAEGMDAVSMRRVATALGSAPMTLYTYVPGRDELVELMVDAVYSEVAVAHGGPAAVPWRERVREVIEANKNVYERHPWVATVDTTRPALGPGAISKYNRELAAFDGHGLDDVTMDAALAWTLAFVRDWSRTALAATRVRDATALNEQQWWDRVGPVLGLVLDGAQYPLAVRVGAAAGKAQGAAWEALQAYDFGLARVLDGLAPLLDRKPRSTGVPSASAIRDDQLMRIELVGVDCPVLQGVTVGLQRGKQVVDERAATGEDIIWQIEARIVEPGPELRGPYVHGRPGARFLYLCWLRGVGGVFRRAKLMLDEIPPALIDEELTGIRGRLSLTMPDGTPLCAAVRPPVVTWSAL